MPDQSEEGAEVVKRLTLAAQRETAVATQLVQLVLLYLLLLSVALRFCRR